MFLFCVIFISRAKLSFVFGWDETSELTAAYGSINVILYELHIICICVTGGLWKEIMIVDLIIVICGVCATIAQENLL